MDLPITVGHIGFDSPNAYTVSGANSLTLDVGAGDATINVARGSHVITNPVILNDNTVVTVWAANSNLAFAGGITSTMRLSKQGPGSVSASTVHVGPLSIDQGTLTLEPDGDTSFFSALTIAGTPSAPIAKLDLTNNAAIIDYTGSSPAETVRQQILAGRGGPGFGKTWNGNGITSSAAKTANATEPESRSIGYAENSLCRSAPTPPSAASR